MGYLTTALDLKRDALWLAGEPGDGGSPYDERVYEWLTVIQRSLIVGGKFGPSTLQPVDWFWARAWPRGTIQLMQPMNARHASLAAFTTGSRSVSASPLVAPIDLDLAGYRIQQDQTPARHLVLNCQHDEAGNTSYLTLQDPWTGPSLLTKQWLAYPDTYELPVDFVRGVSPLFVMAYPSFGFQYTVDVIDTPDLERGYPQAWPMAGGRSGGLPLIAARVTETKLRFSHYLHTPETPLPVQIEFEYIRRPEVITEGSIPIVPLEHRRILAYGCAYLILQDKDDSTAGAAWQQFEAQWKAMLDDYRRGLRRMSSRWGIVQPSRLTGAWGPPLYTSGGLPVWSW